MVEVVDMDLSDDAIGNDKASNSMHTLSVPGGDTQDSDSGDEEDQGG
jgi:hypothetical protein